MYVQPLYNYYNEFLCSSSVSCGEMKLTISCSKSSVPLLADIFHSSVHKTGKEHFRVLKYEGVSPFYLISICSSSCISGVQIRGL